MPNPLDIYVSKGKHKLVVKLPVVPRLADAVRRGGLGRGAESYDDMLEKWRQGVEKTLERLTSNLQTDTATANQVTNVTNIISSTPAPPAGDFVTEAELDAAIAAEAAIRAAADADLQAQIDALDQALISIDVSCGTVAIGNGVDSGTVSGLGLPFTPSRVMLTVQKPVDGLNLWADVVGSATSGGFDYSLNGLTDSADYDLFYIAIPPMPNTPDPVVLAIGGVPVENGTLDLAAAVESGTVTGLGLDYTPAQVFLSLRQPADGLNLFPTVAGIPTPDGFDFDLSGLTDVGGYRLDYLVAPPADGGNGFLALGNGVESGVVTGLGLSYTPSSVLVWVDIPTGGLQISAMVVGNPSSDGFAFTLSGLTDSVNYRLGYLLIA